MAAFRDRFLTTFSSSGTGRDRRGIDHRVRRRPVTRVRMDVPDRPTGEPLWRARAGAFPPGEFVGQESFVTAGEVL